MANQFAEFLTFSQQQQQQGHQIVLATIVETQGSTYQKAGARMLISSSGDFIGILAGGCFEGDLIEQSHDVFTTGTAKEVYYDMRSDDDVIWGLGLGCNGAVRILLQRLESENNFAPLSSLHDAASSKQSIILISVVSSEHEHYPNGYTCLSSAEDFSHSTLISALAGTLSIDTIKKPLYIQGSIDNKAVAAFIQKVLPPRQLLLLGAGPDSVPLATMATQLRWQVTIADHRPANLDSTRFPPQTQLVEVNPDNIVQELHIEHFDSMVLMTHSYDYDLRYLRALADTAVPFIGLLGPSHRRDRLYKDLGELSEKIQSRSHGPVGVDIGAKTPEEIALSILAELQAVYADKAARFLDERPLQTLQNTMTADS